MIIPSLQTAIVIRVLVQYFNDGHCLRLGRRKEGEKGLLCFFVFVMSLLRPNTHTIQRVHLKYEIQWTFQYVPESCNYHHNPF
jgi:hypothetical protein